VLAQARIRLPKKETTMTIRFRDLSLAVAFIGVFTFGAAAQQPANSPLPRRCHRVHQ